MEILIKATQLILSLSILVIIHELGHFSFARLFNTRVEKFYLFFNAWASLVKAKKIDGKWKLTFFQKNKEDEEYTGTEYGVGWLPLGGYVKISGMIDESMDKEQLAKPPKDYEFRAKPAWQRLLMMVGGVMFNIILAVFIYIMVLFWWGETYLPTANAKYGIACDSIALDLGLQNGDKIISVDNKHVEKFRSLYSEIILNEAKTIQVTREGRNIEVNLPPETLSKILKSEKRVFEEGIPFIIKAISENSAAKKAGLQKDDRIVGINGKRVELFQEYPPLLAKQKGKEVTLTVLRGSSEMEIKSMVSEEGRIGVQVVTSMKELFEIKKIDYDIIAAVPAGLSKGYDEIKNYIKQFKLIFAPETEAYKSLGGFIAIGNIFPPLWDWHAFWLMTAFLSIILGVINILPIPALDGGHVMFLLYEIISGRKPSDKFMEYAQLTGMLLLFSLLIFANGNDIVKLFN